MRKLCAGVVAVLVCAGFASALVSEEWKEHTSKEGRFKVKFPGEPTKQEKPLAGGLNLYIFGVERNAGTEAFMVMYNDIPDENVRSNTPENMLKLCRDGVLNSSNGKVSKEKSIKVGGHPGLEFHFTGSSGGKDMECSWRLIIANKRLYQVAVLRFGQAPAPEDVRQFFDSLNLTNAGVKG
jgi:hypothetical protein